MIAVITGQATAASAICFHISDEDITNTKMFQIISAPIIRPPADAHFACPQCFDTLSGQRCLAFMPHARMVKLPA